MERGRAGLVPSLIRLLRRPLEKQALQRIEAGSLTDGEIGRMGRTVPSLERKMEGPEAASGLPDGDPKLDRGPLGDLIRDA